MWSKRDVDCKDEEIAKVDARKLDYKIFYEKYISTNTPVIICNLNVWKCEERLNWNKIDKYLKDDYILKNVFVSLNKDNRFLYFDNKKEKKNEKQNENNNKMEEKKEEIEYCQKRCQMSWKEFKSRINKNSNKNNSDNNLDPILGKCENYYLYGEPLPPSFWNEIEMPSFLSFIKNENFDKNDYLMKNSMIWISSNYTCSPLHFDLCHGLLHQIVGTKKVCLFKPNVDDIDQSSFYPFDLNSKYQRQSMIDDIHKPNKNKFFKFLKQRAMQGVLNENEALYIPFGYWHQIESSKKLIDNISSISLTFRWNPDLDKMKEYFNIYKNAPMMKDMIFNQCIEQSDLPFYVKQFAHIWRDCWIINLASNDDNNDDTESIGDTTNDTNEANLSDID